MSQIKAMLCMMVLLVATTGCAHQVMPFNPQPERSRVFVIVPTTHGAVAGYQAADGLQVFQGIPYAQPPIGRLRFAPPQPMAPWSYVRPAYLFGPSCPQSRDEFEPGSLLYQDEDCLSLNIWTPGTGAGRRPVIVYIHGGGFVEGGTGDPLYNGTNIVRRGDIVFASINYRVGPFGFLALDAFGPEFAGSGCLALQDQIAGLTWIKRNIARFGGDPDNITIMGESAGSASVMFLMVAPQAKGLFQKAIAQSGAINLARTKAQAAAYTQRFMALAGVTNIEGLRALTSQRLVAISEKLLEEAGFESDLVFAPVLDGVVVPTDPGQAFADGAAAGIPFLNGTNDNEYRYWLNYFPALQYIPSGILLSFAPRTLATLGDRREEVLKYYRKERPDPGRGGVTFGLAADMLFRIPHIRVSDLQSTHAPVWMYRFDWRSQVSDDFGACHAIEVPFVLGNFDSPTSHQIVGPHPPQVLSETMMLAWIAFARSGNPNHPGMAAWPAYDTAHRATMIFNAHSAVQDDPDRAVRLLYQGIL